MVLKLKLWTTEDGKTFLKDVYISVENIIGFYIPEKAEEDQHIETEAINLFLYGMDMITVSQEKHIVDYLTERFVKPSISETQHLKK